jgi:hypothetical protein
MVNSIVFGLAIGGFFLNVKYVSIRVTVMRIAKIVTTIVVVRLKGVAIITVPDA